MTQKCPKCETINPADSKFCKECATPLPSGAREQVSFTRTLETTADELARGTLFAGRYEIIEELGTGGMGKVYRAFDKKLDEEVALKFLKPEIAADRRTVERFRNEIKVARKITHPSVCRTHDLGEDGKTLYITMEYVRGEDLKSLIKRTGQLTAGKAVLIARQVAEGLGQAHKLGIVHRDLKPHNVMIDKDGNAKIMDFGIARSLQGGGITAEGGIIGTPEYMSPEQVEGKPADARADIYALGIILFEMVTGQVPFEGETPFSVANKHKTEPPPDPKTLAPNTPAALGRLILRCLEKDREKRYLTTEELLADLAVVESGLPTTERTAAGRTTAKRRPTLSRKVTVELTPRKVLIPAAAVVVLTGAFLIWRFLFHPATADALYVSNKPSVAILNFNNKSGDIQLDSWRDLIQGMLFDRLQQSKYIYVLPLPDVNSVIENLKLRDASTYTSRNLRDIGKSGPVKYVATGYYAKVGEIVRVQVTVQEAATGRPVCSEGAEGRGKEMLFLIIDELATKIKPRLDISAVDAASDIDGSMERDTTSSIEAYDLYIKGWRLNASGERPKAAAMLERAVTLDPEFASAYRTLAAVYNNLGRYEERDKCAAKALELCRRSNRISVREKLLIEAYYGPDELTQVKKCKELLDLFPEENRAPTLLGYIYHNVSDFEKAVPAFELALRNSPRTQMTYANLAEAYNMLGQYDKAITTLKAGMKRISDGKQQALLLSHMVMPYAVRGQYGKARAVMDKASVLNPEIPFEEYRGRIFLLQAQFGKAEDEYAKLLEKNAIWARRLRANLYMTRGMFEKAIGEYRSLGDLGRAQNNPQLVAESRWGIIEVLDARGDTDAAARELAAGEQDIALGLGYGPGSISYRKILLLARKKSFEEARKALGELPAVDQNHPLFNKRQMLSPLFLQGRIELEQGNAVKAVELLAQAEQLSLPGQGIPESRNFDILHVSTCLESLAQAYYSAGNLEKARLEYEEITELTWGRTRFGGARYARSFYMLGQIAEKQGKKAEARRRYGEFLELWKNADPGLPEVEDAKKRLAAL